MSEFCKSIKDWSSVYLQSILLVCLLISPLVFNLNLFMHQYVVENNIEFTTSAIDAVIYFLMFASDFVFGIVLLFIGIYFLHKFNYDKILNNGNTYHKHWYSSYQYSRNVLGFRKCNLINVPIYQQIRLVINDVFPIYCIGESDAYAIIDDEKIITKLYGVIQTEICLILCDTYDIAEDYIPAVYRKKPVIVVKHEVINGVRCYSMKYCQSIKTIISNLPDSVSDIHLFSTLNPKHCLWIAQNVFKLGDRKSVV